MNALDTSGLSAMQNHELRLDYSGDKRSVRKGEDGKAIPPLIWSLTGGDLEADYAAHVKGARRNKGAGKDCLHSFIQFPTDLPITPENEERMLKEAVDFINLTHGGNAVFRARLDRDEMGQHGVDVFLAPKYSKTTKRGSETWVSLSKFGKELAVMRFGEKQVEKKNEETNKFEPVFDENGAPVMADCNSAYYQGQALQDEWFEYLRDFMKLDWVQRGEKKLGRDKDRLEPEEYGLQKDREAFEKEKAEHENTVELVEDGLSNLSNAIESALDGTHDEEFGSEYAYALGPLKSIAPQNRVTNGFLSRCFALFGTFTVTKKELVPLPEGLLNSLTECFDRVALWAAEVAKVRQEAKKILQDATEAAQSAAKGILDAARAEATQITQEATQKAQTEAKGILQQAHKDAASLEPLAETIRAFQDAPEGMQQLALNLEATEEVAMEALRRLGVAEKRLDLFGEYAGQDRDPPPVLELVMKRTGRRAQEKTNDLMATLARNGPRR
jgi:vacuolar-type H+-ATPase subunit H